MLSAWAESAESVSDPVVREEIWVHLATEGYDFDVLNQLTFRAMFVAAVSLFEFELLRLCYTAQRYSQNPERQIDEYRFDLSKARGYLGSMEVDVPIHSTEWQDVQRLYQVRNAIVHGGGFLTRTGDTLDFARRQGIIVQREGNPRPNQRSPRVSVKLELTRAFCDEALNTLEKLLLQISDAWVNKLIVGNDQAITETLPD